MTRRAAHLLTGLVASALGLGATALVAPASAVPAQAPAATAAATSTATSTYVVRTLHFAVTTGPDGSQPCDIVGDLYTPTSASTAHPVPAILTTNGFGGSKDDQAGIGKAFASRGYAVLSYSGLGFGGSGCKITLDDPDYDGRAASQLVSFLGGRTGIAFTDAQHTTAVPALTGIVRDSRGHDGKPSTNDPRVGMVGGSYGGSIQFATAAVDPRVDTLVPFITWNDLSYSLGPNNTDQVVAGGVTTRTPGATKSNWGVGFTALGVENGVQNGSSDPSRLFGCPNFTFFVCPALVTAGSTGYFQPDAIASLRHASVASYVKQVRVPTLLLQGENDTLFNLNEAVATYRSLKAQGTPVKMVWQSWGHSDLTPLPGEYDPDNPDPATQYETGRVAAWFDHYLRGSSVSTGPEFAYFRDWVGYTGNAAPAYAAAASYPVGRARTLYLSGSGDLVPSSASVTPGQQSLVTPPAGAPTSLDPVDVVGTYIEAAGPLPEQDAPGTAATWRTATLTKDADVVGSPVAHLRVQAPSAALTQGQGPGGKLVLFLKVLDVAPDGTASLIRSQIAPVRVPDVTKAFCVTMPAIAHRFAAGHKLAFTVAGGSVNYRGGLTPTPVTIFSGTGQSLTLPVVG